MPRAKSVSRRASMLGRPSAFFTSVLKLNAGQVAVVEHERMAQRDRLRCNTRRLRAGRRACASARGCVGTTREAAHGRGRSRSTSSWLYVKMPVSVCTIPVTILLNGDPHELPGPLTVAELLAPARHRRPARRRRAQSDDRQTRGLRGNGRSRRRLDRNRQFCRRWLIGSCAQRPVTEPRRHTTRTKNTVYADRMDEDHGYLHHCWQNIHLAPDRRHRQVLVAIA